MAVSDIASLVVSRILDEAGNVNRSIAESDVAEPGPPTGVQRFSGADASGGALLAELGARVFQRARERRAANQKAEKQRLDEEYRRAQIEKMVAASQPDPTEAVTVDGRTFHLKPEAAATLLERMGNRKPDEPLLTTDLDTGKPLPTPMKMSDWLQWRRDKIAHDDRVASRTLAATLVRERTARGGQASTTLGATRYLTQLPSATEVRARAEAAATAHVDSTQKFGSGPLAQEKRNNAIKDAADGIFLRMMQEQDSLRTAPLARLRSAAVDDSTAAAQPIQLPKDFTDLFQ